MYYYYIHENRQTDRWTYKLFVTTEVLHVMSYALPIVIYMYIHTHTHTHTRCGFP